MYTTLFRPSPRAAADATTVTAVATLDAALGAEWDALATGASLFVSRPYLRAVERDHATSPRYLLARDRGGRLVAALPCYGWDGGAAPALDHYDPFAMGGRWLLGERTEPAEWRPTLFVGTRSGYVNEWLVHPDWRDRTRVLVRRLLAAAARLGAGSGCRSLGAMWLTSTAARDVQACLRSRDRLLLGAGSATLDIGWDSFDGYLARLGPSRRHTVRRELERFRRSGLRVTEAGLADSADILGELASPLQAKYGHRMAAAALTEQFRAQADELDRESWVLLCWRRDRPVGFTCFFRWGDTLYGRAAGFDYDAVAGAAAYFNLAFYRPIAHAIATGARRIHLGLASWEAKVLRGARLDPHWLWIVPPTRWRSSWGRRVPPQVEGHRRWLEEMVRPVVGELPQRDWDPEAWRDPADPGGQGR